MTDLAAVAHFNDYDPSSFGWPRTVDLVPFEFQGTNFGQCARDVLPVFMAVLTELVPHIPGGINFGPHDDWAYATTDDLAGGVWSFHHHGIAFDLNWDENPMGDYATNPDAGKLGAIPHDAASAIAMKYGCEYGGDWSGGEGHVGFKDYMHFECHLTPDVARTVQPIITTEEDMPLTEADKQELLTTPIVDANGVKHSSVLGFLQTITKAVGADLAVDRADLAVDQAAAADDKPATP